MAVSVVARFVTIGEAECARSALNAAGIDAALADDQIITVNWLYSNALGGVKLLVPQNDAEAATSVLAEEASPHVPEPEPDLSGTVVPIVSGEDRTSFDDVGVSNRCPRCGSENLVRVPRLRLFVFLSVIAVGIGTVAGQRDMAVAFAIEVALITFLIPSHRCAVRRETLSPQPAPSFEALPPLISDTLDSHCPRCGSTEVHHILYRKLKAASMIFSLGVVFVVPIWLLLAKWKCDQCGLLLWVGPPRMQ